MLEAMNSKSLVSTSAGRGHAKHTRRHLVRSWIFRAVEVALVVFSLWLTLLAQSDTAGMLKDVILPHLLDNDFLSMFAAHAASIGSIAVKRQLRHDRRAHRAGQPAAACAVADWASMQRVVHLASCCPEHTDCAMALPRMLELFQTGTDETYRIIALDVLNAMRSEEIMQQLARCLKHEKSQRIRRLMTAILADHYGPSGD